MMPYKLSFVAKLEEVDSRFNACGSVQSFQGSATGAEAIALAEAMGIALPEHAIAEMTPTPTEDAEVVETAVDPDSGEAIDPEPVAADPVDSAGWVAEAVAEPVAEAVAEPVAETATDAVADEAAPQGEDTVSG